LNDKELKIQ